MTKVYNTRQLVADALIQGVKPAEIDGKKYYSLFFDGKGGVIITQTTPEDLEEAKQGRQPLIDKLNSLPDERRKEVINELNELFGGE